MIHHSSTVCRKVSKKGCGFEAQWSDTEQALLKAVHSTTVQEQPIRSLQSLTTYYARAKALASDPNTGPCVRLQVAFNSALVPLFPAHSCFVSI